MHIEISDLRVTLLQLEKLDSLVDPNSPAGFLSEPWKYEKEFTQAQAATSSWVLQKQGQNFWKYLLGGVRLRNAKPPQVVKNLVPVFYNGLVQVQVASGFPVSLSCIGFAYPHVIAALFTLRIQDAKPLDEVIDRALSLRNSFQFNLTNQNITVGSQGVLSAILDNLRMKVQKNTVPGKQGPISSISTFIDGTGADASVPVQKNDPIHLALNALCTWNPQWRKSVLNNLDLSKLTLVRGKISGQHSL